MKIHTAEYIKSAPSLKECPDFDGLPEIVLVGRSNVGKSSFINSLTRRKNLARTSNTPGKTRYLNFYKITYSSEKAGEGVRGRERTPGTKSAEEPRSILFVDLPGYGYAKVSKSEQAQWRKNLEAYLSKRESIRLVVQLMDARHGAQDNDIQMYEWLQFTGRPTQVILTKTDKLSRNEATRCVAQSAKALDITPADIMTYSAETHQGRDLAWARVEAALTLSLPPLPVD